LTSRSSTRRGLAKTARWGLLALFSVAVACGAQETTAKKKGALPTGEDLGDDFGDTSDPTRDPDFSTTNAGTFGAGERQSKGASDAGRMAPDGEAPASSDAGSVLVDGGSGTDGGTTPARVYCAGTLGAGDLAVVELMVTSRTGSGDVGEWVEIQSTRSCWLKISTLRIESPRGTTGVDFALISQSFELPPYGIFLVADTLDPAKNNGLPSPRASFESSDVLKNDGDTVRILSGTTLIDELTYPSFSNISPGRTLSFPSDCLFSVRKQGTLDRWSLSFEDWKPGLVGTPGKDNDDVTCY
jgi:hypothetical protein